MSNYPEILECSRCRQRVAPTIEKNGPHLTARCPQCNSFIKHVSRKCPARAGELTTSSSIQSEVLNLVGQMQSICGQMLSILNQKSQGGEE